MQNKSLKLFSPWVVVVLVVLLYLFGWLLSWSLFLTMFQLLCSELALSRILIYILDLNLFFFKCLHWCVYKPLSSSIKYLHYYNFFFWLFFFNCFSIDRYKKVYEYKFWVEKKYLYYPWNFYILNICCTWIFYFLIYSCIVYAASVSRLWSIGLLQYHVSDGATVSIANRFLGIEFLEP